MSNTNETEGEREELVVFSRVFSSTCCRYGLVGCFSPLSSCVVSWCVSCSSSFSLVSVVGCQWWWWLPCLLVVGAGGLSPPQKKRATTATNNEGEGNPPQSTTKEGNLLEQQGDKGAITTAINNRFAFLLVGVRGRLPVVVKPRQKDEERGEEAEEDKEDSGDLLFLSSSLFLQVIFASALSCCCFCFCVCFFLLFGVDGGPLLLLSLYV